MAERHPAEILREILEEEPAALQVLQDIRDFNQMIEEGEIDPDFESGEVREYIDSFDSEWPYFEKDISFTGQVKLYPVSQFAELPVEPGSVSSVDGGAGVCGGFGLFRESPDAKPRVVHVIGFDIDDGRIVLPADKKFDYKGIAEIDEIFIQHYKDNEYDTQEYMAHYLPEIAEEIDERILNADNEVTGLEQLRGLEIHHGVSSENLGKTKEVIASYINEYLAFEEVVPYSAAVRGAVHLIDENGSIGNKQQINFEWQHVLIVPQKVVIIPKFTYGEGRNPHFSYEDSVPALVTEIYDKDGSKYAEATCIEAVIPITDDLIISSNAGQLKRVEIPKDD